MLRLILIEILFFDRLKMILVKLLNKISHFFGKELGTDPKILLLCSFTDVLINVCLVYWWQLIAERQMSLSTVKEESRKVQQSLERRLAEAQSQWDVERRQLNRDADQTSKVRNTSSHHLITKSL